MATRRRNLNETPEGWEKIGEAEPLSSGKRVYRWFNDEMKAVINLTENIEPTETVLNMMAANGVYPKAVGNSDPADLIPVDNEPDGLDAEPESALDRVMEQFRDISNVNALVKIHRIREGAKEIYCGEVSVQEFDKGGLELIRTNWGGGKYRIRVYGPHPNSGKYSIVVNETVEIEQSLVPVKIDNAPPALGEALSRVMGRIDDMAQRMTVAAPAAPTMLEMLEIMAKFQAMSGKSTGPVEKPKTIVEQLTEMRMLKEFVSDLAPAKEGAEDPGLMGVAAQAIDLIKTGMQRQQANPAQARLPAPEIRTPASFIEPAPIPFPETEINEQPEGDDVNVFQKIVLVTMLQSLCSKAEANDDVESHAPGLADKASNELIDLLEMDDVWFDSLCNFAPELKERMVANKAWFEKLRERVLDLCYDDTDGEDAKAHDAKPVDVKPSGA